MTGGSAACSQETARNPVIPSSEEPRSDSFFRGMPVRRARLLAPLGITPVRPEAPMRHGVLILAGTLAAMNLLGQSSEDLKQKGIKAFEAGQFAAAEATFKLLVQQDPSGENYSYEAVAELRTREVQAAIAHFQRAIELGYAPGSVHYNLGLALLRLLKTRAGIRELKLAAAQEPGNAE